MSKDLKKNRFNLFSKKNTCPGDEDLAAYMDNRLSAREMTKIQEHMNQCPECRATLAATLESRQIPVRKKPPQDWIDKAQALVPEQQATNDSGFPKNVKSLARHLADYLTLPRLAPAALTIAVVMMISFYWVHYRPDQLTVTDDSGRAVMQATPAPNNLDEPRLTNKAASPEDRDKAEAFSSGEPTGAPTRGLQGGRTEAPTPKIAAQKPQSLARAQANQADQGSDPTGGTGVEMLPEEMLGPESFVQKEKAAPKSKIKGMRAGSRSLKTNGKDIPPLSAAAPVNSKSAVQKRVFKLIHVRGAINHRHVTWLINHEISQAEACLFKAKAQDNPQKYLFKIDFIWQENKIRVSKNSPNQDMADCLLPILNQADLTRPEAADPGFSLVLALTNP